MLGGAGLSGVKVRKGTVRTGMNTHKWGIRVFCLRANETFCRQFCTKATQMNTRDKFWFTAEC